MTHKEKILELLDDGLPHSNFEIHQKTSILRYSARVLDINRDFKKENSGWFVRGYDDEHDPQKYWYQLIKTNQYGIPIPVPATHS